jgi:hypothetical protein
MKKTLQLIVVGLLLIEAQALAYDKKIVHKTINGSAIKQSQYFIKALSNFGYNKIEDSLGGQEIWWWFEDGGTEEGTCPPKIVTLPIRV